MARGSPGPERTAGPESTAGPENSAQPDRGSRLVLITTSPRLPAGLLSWPAWAALRTGPTLTGSAEHPQLPYLRDAGVSVEVLSAGSDSERANRLRDRARHDGVAVWLADSDGDLGLVRALGDILTRESAAGVEVELEVLPGSYDPPGARLLDVVTTMDRLRSPGGCPWDAEQTHQSLARYLVEEAYEAVEAIEHNDLPALREELGDVLLQVAFHARLAEELATEPRWSIDDVAADLVRKLVRRHPHVFGAVTVSGAAEVVANWETIKAAEAAEKAERAEQTARSRTSDEPTGEPGTLVTDGIAMAQPALALAARLQHRAAGVGLPASLLTASMRSATDPAAAVAAAAAGLFDAEEPPGPDRVGELLFAAVALARSVGVDPEAALRGTSRRFRDHLAFVQRAEAKEGRSLADLGPGDWQRHWATGDLQ